MIKFLVNLTTLVVSIFIIFLCCEGALRAKYGFVKNNADSVRPEIRVLRAKYGPVKNNAGPLGLGIPDNELGWIPNENLLFYVYDEIFTHKELNKHGFRVFGDVRSTKKKVLFVGDSYTQAIHVPREKTYYGMLQQRLPIEVFAFGCSGYGTLQEYMIIEKYMQIIKPDAIVIQGCANDIVNNSYDLEKRSLYSNNHQRRPYLTVDNYIEYHNPSSIWETAGKYSAFISFLMHRIDKLMVSFYSIPAKDPLLQRIKPGDKYYNIYKNGLIITEHLIKKIRSLAPPDVKIYFFCVFNAPPLSEDFNCILDSNDVVNVRLVSESLDAAKARGVPIYCEDHGHWSEQGHAIVAIEIEKAIRKNDALFFMQARH
jgi:hypothetical protein